MVRKYLDRKDKTDSEDYITSKNEQSKKESIENIDPLNAEERTLVLTNQEPKLKNIKTPIININNRRFSCTIIDKNNQRFDCLK